MFEATYGTEKEARKHAAQHEIAYHGGEQTCSMEQVNDEDGYGISIRCRACAREQA